MNLAYSRTDRVAELIHREVSRIILHQVNDPRLKGVTVTHVKVSPDLKVATVFVSSLKNKEEKGQVLNRARKFIRGELGHNLKLRYTPHIVFKWDDSVEYSLHIAEVLAELRTSEDDSFERGDGE